MFDFGHIHGAAIGPAKAEIAGIFAQHIDLFQDRAAWGHFHHRPFSVARDVQIASTSQRMPSKP